MSVSGIGNFHFPDWCGQALNILYFYEESMAHKVLFSLLGNLVQIGVQ